MACFSAGVPSTAVYLVWPSWMAWIAASLMLSGVSKSGSPAPSPMTSRPAAFNSRALVETAMVGDGLMRPSDCDRNGMTGPQNDSKTMIRRSRTLGPVNAPCKAATA